jgi:hypothetical protein
MAAGVAGALVGGSRIAVAAGSSDFNAKDPASVLRAVTRMRYSEDGRLTMGWLKALRYGVVDAEITPLFGMVTGTFGRHRVMEDGSVENVSFELAFYTDLESGEVLDRITIPYTNKSVEVPRLLLGPNKSRTKPLFHELMESGPPAERTDSESAMRPLGSTRVERWLGPVTIKDNNVWITEASSAVLVPADPKADKVVYNESLVITADYADLMNPDLPSVPAKLGYTGVSSWRPWMQMGDHPGHTTSSGFGGKAFDADALPDDYRAMAERFYPEALANPAAILDRI